MICTEFGVTLAWGRIFIPYGADEPKTRLLPSLAEVFQNNKAAFGVNLESYRDFLHVTDVARAFVMMSFKQVGGSFNISSGEPVRIRDVVKLMAGIVVADPNEIFLLSSVRLDEPKYLIGSNDRLLNLGWSKRVSLIEGLKDFYK